MFKHYLTYQFILSFDRDCRTVKIPEIEQKCLVECCEKAIESFKKSIESEHPRDELKWVFVALMYLQDARDLLKKNSYSEEHIWARYNVIEQRLYQIGTELREKEEKQIRLIG